MTVAITIAGEERFLSHWVLRVPEQGAWRGELRIESNAALVPVKGDSIVVTDSLGNEWRGSVRAVTTFGAYDSIEFMAGAGQLDATTVERFYGHGLDAAEVLRDLCGDVGETADDSPVHPLPQWRTRGQWLIDEIDQLAQYTTQKWRALPDGRLSLNPSDNAADAPGDWLDAMRTCRVYECPDLPPLTGTTIDGWRIGDCVYQAGEGRPTVTVYESIYRPRPIRAGAVGATVTSVVGARISVDTDSGVGLSDIPLWSVAGFVPTVRIGTRVIIIDLGDDPRSTIAIAGTADSEVDAIELAQGESDPMVPSLPPFVNGRVIRYGDTIIVPSGPAATPTPQVLMPSFPPGPPIPVSRVKA